MEGIGLPVEPGDVETVKAKSIFVYGLQFVKRVIGINTVDEGVADYTVQVGGPALVLITGVGGDDKEEVDAEFTQNEGVAVEETVFEMFVGRRVLDAFLFVPDCLPKGM